jgi:hypothetical protein
VVPTLHLLFCQWVTPDPGGRELRQVPIITGTVIFIRVARWFVFKPKIQIWVKFGGSCNGRCWYILWICGPFYGILKYFMDLWHSWYIFSVLVFCTKKNLATPIFMSRDVAQHTKRISSNLVVRHHATKSETQNTVHVNRSLRGSWHSKYLVFGRRRVTR